MSLALFPAEHLAVTEARESEFHPTPLDVVAAFLRGVHEPLPLEVCALAPNPRRRP